MNTSGKLKLNELPLIKSRLSFIYLEHAKVSCYLNSLSVYSVDYNGTVSIPVSQFLVIMFGPGVTVTSDVLSLLSESGVMVLWVGEHGVRFYAVGRALTESSKYLERQVELWSNQRTRLDVARKMFNYRFPDEDVSRLKLRELTLREASRVKAVYKACAEKYGIKFTRQYDVVDFSSGDPVNQALSSANVCLYGLCHAIIEALGMSPSLGFVHKGHVLSFVYDIADLYKHEITIPIAFSVGVTEKSDYANIVRRRCRDVFREKKLIKRVIKDIHLLMGFDDIEVTVLSGVELRGD